MERGPGLLERGPGLLAPRAGLLDRSHGPGLPAARSPARGGLRDKPTPRAGGGPTAPAAAGFGPTAPAAGLSLSSMSLLEEPKKDPLKGLRRGDCNVVVVLVWPLPSPLSSSSLPLPFLGERRVRSGERSGDCRLLTAFFQGEGGGVAFGVQTCFSDLTWRLQWGHLPDMKVLPPTVEYL